MTVVVSGARGLIGSALVPLLTAAGHRVARLVREPNDARPDAIAWDPVAGRIDRVALERCDAVVHLAGEGISGRWTAAKKSRIYASRVDGTRVLVDALTRLTHPPRTLLAASAIGYYGDRNADVLTEDSAGGAGFLADVVRDWEAATTPAATAGIRVVNLRFGVVLSANGGALASMLPPFRLGLGGPIGTGQQYMSWIALDDAARAALHALTTTALSGPVNVVAPAPVTNREFTTALAQVLRRPALLPMPALAVKLLFGEMGEALLLASTRVEPERLQHTGYRYLYPVLADALRHVLLDE